MNKTMLFSFDPPIVFERIYTFDNPNFIFCWYAEDSNPLYIKTTNYRVKKTLVTKLYIAFSPKCNKYEIMLSDEFGYNDDFRVSITEFPNFLKRFDLL